jgi:hypothetical protein
MSFAEIVLLACLLIVLVVAWLRLDALQRELQHQRDQLEQHIQRGHAASVAPSAPVAAAPQSPPAAVAPRGRVRRPSLRLVKD